MSAVVNHVEIMRNLHGQCVDKFGKDQTGLIKYQFNDQGWRGTQNYEFVPRHVFFGNSSVFGIGVAQTQIFSNMFEQSHNYGLAANYNNQDIVTTILNFVHSSWYETGTKMSVVWSDRNPDQLVECYNKVKHLSLQHFFCGLIPVRDSNCWPMIAMIDQDVSGTHMGPDTHKLFYKILCTVFKQ